MTAKRPTPRTAITGILLSGLVAILAAGCAVEEADADQATSALSYDAELGNRVANTAARREGYASGNWCLKEVGDSLDMAGIRPTFPRLPSAVDFDDWARSHPAEVAKRGYERQSLGSIDEIPRGSIITWRPGQCGYHPQYGHIEIVIGSNRACSDYCGRIARGCGMPGVYVPVGNGGGGDSCSVKESKLYCTNRVTPMYKDTDTTSPVVNTLRSTYSWFTCWKKGGPVPGGGSTWYQTVGDDNSNIGYVPSSALDTTVAFDSDATAKGLPECAP